MYKVKVLKPELNPHKVTRDGYLKFFETDEPSLYARGEAIKKANWFGGKIEKEETVPAVVSSMKKINGTDLDFEVRELMRNREDFAGKEKNSYIYKADIFVTIRLELEQMALEDKGFKPKDSIITQLVQLSQVCSTEYVLIECMCFS